jgi:hypothetical protein
MREYVLWGRPAGSTDALGEQVLTCTPNPERVDAVQAMAARDGFHTFRVQVLDGSRPDFAAGVR